MLYDPNLILTADNRSIVIDHLAWAGVPVASLVILTNVQLSNLYHERGSQSIPMDTRHSAVLDVLAAFPNGSPDEELIRYLARYEAQALIDGIAPRRIEIVTPTTTHTFEGIVHYRTELVLRIVSLGHAIMLVGPAGCGKTTIGEHVATALGLQFYITSTINDTHELLGFVDGHGHYHGTPFRTAFQHGGLWIADEIDAWDAAALLAANSALANGFATFPDMAEPVRRHADFRMVATANTFGTGADRVYVGRNELDAASLDRFAVVEVDYDLDLERMFAAGADRWLEHVWSIRRKVADKKIRHVVSSRAIAMGSKALLAGIEWSDVEEIYLYKGLSERDREKVI